MLLRLKQLLRLQHQELSTAIIGKHEDVISSFFDWIKKQKNPYETLCVVNEQLITGIVKRKRDVFESTNTFDYLNLMWDTLEGPFQEVLTTPTQNLSILAKQLQNHQL